MYFVLGLCIVLAAMLVLNTFASLIASVLWKVFGRRISTWSAASCAQTLFLLRTIPAAIGIGCVLFLFGPAYLTYEPRAAHEDVSVKLALVAAFSALGIAMAMVRGIATWRATARLATDWLRVAEPIRIPNLNIPAFQVEHRFPLIAVVGALRPRLFIAQQIFQSLTHGELSAALEHEVGHVLAQDNLKRGLIRACRDVLLIIPCGRHLDSAWAEASEAAADEYAARRDRRMGLDLASALVKIARMIPAGARPAMAAGAFLVSDETTRGFKARVRRLLQIANDPEDQITPKAFSQLLSWMPVGLTLLIIAFTASHSYVLSSVQSLIEQAVYILH